MENPRFRKAVVITVVFLLASLIQAPSIKSNVRSDVHFEWYPTVEDAFAALVNDEADIFCYYSLSHEQFEYAQTDPNIQLAPYDENGIFEFDINNNYSIMDYPNARSPTNELKVRQAIAHLINKSYITEEILPEFWGERIDAPISNALSGWWNTSVVGSNYPYPYDPDAAAALLASLGFNDTDGNGLLNYPSDWPGIENLQSTDTESMPLKILVRTDHEDRKEAGIYLIHQLEETLANANWPSGFKGGGFATTGRIHILPEVQLIPIIIDRDYHIITGGWSLSKFPPHYMYYLFHSMFWEPYPYGSNYVTDMEYPDLDEQLEKAYYAHNFSAAMFHCKNAQGLLVDKYCVCIWLWNYKCFNAYRKELAGVVSRQGCGINNVYTYMNAYRTNDMPEPIRVALTRAPDQLNIFYSSWFQDWEILDAIYPSLMNVNPYNLAADQPWIAQDWEVGMWIDPQDGQNKTKVTFWIRKDAGVAEPETGQYLRNYTAHDLEFTIWYTYASQGAWIWSKVRDVHHTEVVDNQTLVVYFDEKSLWSLSNIGGLPLLVKDELIPKLTQAPLYPLMEKKTMSFSCWGEEVQFTNDSLVQVINATADGMPIHENTNFIVRGGQDVHCHNVFVPLDIPLELPWNITLTYLYAPNPPTGYYLGSDAGLTWQDTMYSLGPHYPQNISESEAFLRRNPLFFLSPILGEVDWRWDWVGTEKPRSGYYQISLYDAVKLLGAYGSRGDGEYNKMYVPGADIDRTDLCHIGLYDAVTLLNSYGQKFGKTPDP